MLKRLSVSLVFVGLLWMSLGANAQVQVQNLCPYSGHAHSLACLIPDATNTGDSHNLGSFNTTVAQVLGQLPLAAPVSGFVLGFDRKLGIPVEQSLNLGSVLTERGNTVGKHKLFVGFTAQRFVFHTIDGIDMRSIPQVFQFSSTSYGANTSNLSAGLSQYTTIIAFGVSDRMDVSVTIPYERVSLAGGFTNGQGATSSGNVFPSNPASNYLAGSAHGFGDLILNVKGTVYNGEKNKFAAGLETRLPTGDEFNFLGSGALGLKPYVVFSRTGRITPHANFGYQWNDYSYLYLNPNSCVLDKTCNGTLRLPPSLDYSAGVDIGVAKWLTFVGDFVGQHYFNSPKLTGPFTAGGNVAGLPNCSSSTTAPCSNPAFAAFTANKTVGLAIGSVNVDDASVGVKIRPFGHLILSANALIRLDNGGLRPDRFVPLVGVSYRFGK
jgi:hypothetical protein